MPTSNCRIVSGLNICPFDHSPQCAAQLTTGACLHDLLLMGKRNTSISLARVDIVFINRYIEVGALQICVAHSMSSWLPLSTLYLHGRPASTSLAELGRSTTTFPTAYALPTYLICRIVHKTHIISQHTLFSVLRMATICLAFT